MEERHFGAWGEIVWVKDGNGNNIDQLTILDRGYTGHEHLQDVNLIHMNGRLYDPMTRRFLAPDNYVQDLFNTQNFNRYGYVYNNPLMFNDPSGEVIMPLLVGMAYGALVGAAVSVAVYAISGAITGNLTMNGLGTAMLYGTIGGAISGGLSGIAASIGASSFFQSATYNMMSEVASQVGAGVVMGDNITLGTIAGTVAAGFVGAKFGNWSGVSGGWAKNTFGEIGFNTVRGGVRGAVAGGVGAAIDGKNVANGIVSGARNGAIGGASQSIAMISMFGATYKPSDDQLSYVKTMSEKYGVDYNDVAFRKGGLYQATQTLFNNEREVVWGRNIVTFGNKTTPETMGHEFGHIIQSMKLNGWAVFQGRGIFEQLIWGQSAYNPWLHPNSIEVGADKLFKLRY